MLGVLGADPAVARTAQLRRGLAQQRRGPGPVEALHRPPALRVAIGERLDRAVLGALAAQEHAPVAFVQLGVEHRAAVRADRARRCGQGAAGRHPPSIPDGIRPTAPRAGVYNVPMGAEPPPSRARLIAAAGASAALLAAGGLLVARAGLTLDLGVGRRVRPLGPIRIQIAAPPEIVFDVIAAPYLRKTPRAMRAKLEVIERGTDLVLAAHHTPLAPGLTVTTVETVHFEPPHRISFRLVKGPVPHVVERYELQPHDGGTAFDYRGELGTDLWTLGTWWGNLVAPAWERTVATSLEGVRAEAERRARAQRRQPHA